MNLTFKQFLSIPLISSMLVTQTSSAGIFDYLKGKAANDYSQHPCSTIITLEQQQIDIMKSVKAKIAGDSALMATVSTAVAASSGEQAVNAALKGDALTAILELIDVYVFSNNAIKSGKDGISKNFDQKDMLTQRELALDNLKANPSICSSEAKNKYMLNFLDETKKINALYLEFLNKVVVEAENRDTTIYSATITVIAGLFTYATWQYYSNKSDSFGKFLIPVAGAFTTTVSGAILVSDLVYNKPLKNSLKAKKLELEKKILEISDLENELKAKMN